jgi:hypothetical protein
MRMGERGSSASTALFGFALWDRARGCSWSPATGSASSRVY